MKTTLTRAYHQCHDQQQALKRHFKKVPIGQVFLVWHAMLKTGRPIKLAVLFTWMLKLP